jgi:hypothetical protein
MSQQRNLNPLSVILWFIVAFVAGMVLASLGLLIAVYLYPPPH